MPERLKTPHACNHANEPSLEGEGFSHRILDGAGQRLFTRGSEVFGFMWQAWHWARSTEHPQARSMVCATLRGLLCGPQYLWQRLGNFAYYLESLTNKRKSQLRVSWLKQILLACLSGVSAPDAGGGGM